MKSDAQLEKHRIGINYQVRPGIRTVFQTLNGLGYR